MSEIKDILQPDKPEVRTSNINTVGVLQLLGIVGLIVAVLWTNRAPSPEPGPGPSPNVLAKEVNEGVKQFIIKYNENLSEATKLLAEKVEAQEFVDTDAFRVTALKYTTEARVDASRSTIDGVMGKYVEPGKIAGVESGEVLRQLLEAQSKAHKEVAGALR